MRARISIDWRDIKVCIYEAIAIHVEVIIDCLPLCQSILADRIAYEAPIQPRFDRLRAIAEIS